MAIMKRQRKGRKDVKNIENKYDKEAFHLKKLLKIFYKTFNKAFFNHEI